MRLYLLKDGSADERIAGASDAGRRSVRRVVPTQERGNGATKKRANTRFAPTSYDGIWQRRRLTTKLRQ